jgi:hypothetical protein
MTKRYTLCFCAGLAVWMAGCSTSTSSAPDTRDADIQAVKALEAAWNKDAAAKAVDSFARYYAADATVLVPNAPAYHGVEAIKGGLKPMLADPNFSLTSQHPRWRHRKAETWSTHKAPTP